MIALKFNLEQELKKHHSYSSKIEFLKFFFGEGTYFDTFFFTKNNLTKKLHLDLFPLSSEGQKLLENARGPFHLDALEALPFYDHEKVTLNPLNTLYPLHYGGKIIGYFFFFLQ